MRSRAKELHYEYCAPKPVYHFKLWDSDTEAFPETSEEETNSIDIFCHVVV